MDDSLLKTELQILLDSIPHLDTICSVEELIAEISARYGKDIKIIALPEGSCSFPTGMLVSTYHTEYLFHRNVGDNTYKDHIILHELCHFLCHQSCTCGQYSLDNPRVLARKGDFSISSPQFQEVMAESFASALLQIFRKNKKFTTTAQKLKKLLT